MLATTAKKKKSCLQRINRLTRLFILRTILTKTLIAKTKNLEIGFHLLIQVSSKNNLLNYLPFMALWRLRLKKLWKKWIRQDTLLSITDKKISSLISSKANSLFKHFLHSLKLESKYPFLIKESINMTGVYRCLTRVFLSLVMPKKLGAQ